MSKGTFLVIGLFCGASAVAVANHFNGPSPKLIRLTCAAQRHLIADSLYELADELAEVEDSEEGGD